MLMGNDIYDKYETFNLYLYSISQGQGLSSSNTSSGINTCVDIKMKGLSFLNNTYNTATGLNTDEAFLTSHILYLINKDTGTGTVTPMFNPSIVTFSKGSDIVDININMKKLIDRKYPAVVNNTAFGNFVFHFKIYGIPTRENTITNGLRLF